MKARFTKKIILFVYDGLPLESDYARMDELIAEYKANVHFRNGSSAINGSLEEADYYAGLVPAEYVAAFASKGKVIDDNGNVEKTLDGVATEDKAPGSTGTGVSGLAGAIGSAPKGNPFAKG